MRLNNMQTIRVLHVAFSQKSVVSEQLPRDRLLLLSLHIRAVSSIDTTPDRWLLSSFTLETKRIIFQLFCIGPGH